RPVFFAGEKPSSAPQEAPKSKETMDEVPSLDHMKKEVERFENNIKGFLGDMEKFYNEGLSEDMKVSISTTEFNDELKAKYEAAGMGEKAVNAVQTLVQGLNLMKDAIAAKEDSNRIVLTRISAAVSTINDTMKDLSDTDLYGSKIFDPLNKEMTPGKMAELKMEEEEEVQPEPEDAPEVKEATNDEKVQSSLIAVVKRQDGRVDVQALLTKCAGRQIEIKKDSPLYVEEMANDGLIRAVVTPSSDGQAVRVEYWITGEAAGNPEVKDIRQEATFRLDTESKVEVKFMTETEGRKEQAKLEKNRKKFQKDVEWLKISAPVGSRIEIGDNRAVVKDADEKLYVVQMKGDKEVSRSPFEEGDEGTTLMVTADVVPEQVSASDVEKKEVAKKRINKLAKDLILAASAPQVGDMPKIIQGMAEEIGKIAKANGIDTRRMEGTGATGDR
ncbi:MAG TPA: hypothetical protein PKA32_04200, partial [Candidatus Gracilibacteria bacterium]|nr:hypothetical protein [Candidatus Gracilibacteria bacterium]